MAQTCNVNELPVHNHSKHCTSRYSEWVSEWEGFNVPLDKIYVILGMAFPGNARTQVNWRSTVNKDVHKTRLSWQLLTNMNRVGMWPNPSTWTWDESRFTCRSWHQRLKRNSSKKLISNANNSDVSPNCLPRQWRTTCVHMRACTPSNQTKTTRKLCQYFLHMVQHNCEQDNTQKKLRLHRWY